MEPFIYHVGAAAFIITCSFLCLKSSQWAVIWNIFQSRVPVLTTKQLPIDLLSQDLQKEPFKITWQEEVMWLGHQQLTWLWFLYVSWWRCGVQVTCSLMFVGFSVATHSTKRLNGCVVSLNVWYLNLQILIPCDANSCKSWCFSEISSARLIGCISDWRMDSWVRVTQTYSKSSWSLNFSLLSLSAALILDLITELKLCWRMENKVINFRLCALKHETWQKMTAVTAVAWNGAEFCISRNCLFWDKFEMNSVHSQISKWLSQVLLWLYVFAAETVQYCKPDLTCWTAPVRWKMPERPLGSFRTQQTRSCTGVRQ